MAPATSQNVANQHACRIVKTPDPTLVPNEFATSLFKKITSEINAHVFN